MKKFIKLKKIFKDSSATSKIKNNDFQSPLKAAVLVPIIIGAFLRLDIISDWANYILENSANLPGINTIAKMQLGIDYNFIELLGLRLNLGELYSVFAVLGAVFIAVSAIVLNRGINDPAKTLSPSKAKKYQSLQNDFFKGRITYKETVEYHRYVSSEPKTILYVANLIYLLTLLFATVYLCQSFDKACEQNGLCFVGRMCLALPVPILIGLLAPLVHSHTSEAFSERIIRNRAGLDIESVIATFEYIRVYVNMKPTGSRYKDLLNYLSANSAEEYRRAISRNLEGIVGGASRYFVYMAQVVKIFLGYCVVLIVLLLCAPNQKDGTTFAVLVASFGFAIFTIVWSYLFMLFYLLRRRLFNSIADIFMAIIFIWLAFLNIVLAYSMVRSGLSFPNILFGCLSLVPIFSGVFIFYRGKRLYFTLSEKLLSPFISGKSAILLPPSTESSGGSLGAIHCYLRFCWRFNLVLGLLARRQLEG